MYFNNQTGTKFGFTESGTERICGNALKGTEQKEIFVSETALGSSFPTNKLN